MPEQGNSGVEAALVVLVPEVEGLVGRFRSEHDPAAAAGVPAHITINYPFTPALSDGDELRERLAKLFGRVQPFEFSFRRLARFPDVIYLPPEPVEPFRALIALVAEAFPESPPYGGAHETIVPHLTVADTEDEGTLAAVEAQLAKLITARFPIRSTADRVWLIVSDGVLWQPKASFPLGVD
jgi:2'-5' RNA ligase